MKLPRLCIALICCSLGVARAVEWKAKWITCPDAEPNGYGVCYYRKSFDLESRPRTLPIHVSADNRYRLYVNGQQAGFGPALGDIEHWKYDTIDIARFLKKGVNVIAAEVWNFGELRGAKMISARSGFILQCDGDNRLDTDSTWKVLLSKAHRPLKIVIGVHTRGGTIVNPADIVDGRLVPWGWEQADYNDKQWQYAAVIPEAQSPWRLIPRDIPFMEHSREPFAEVIRAEGLAIDCGKIKGKLHFKVPARTKATILLDNGQETIGFPELVASGGRDGRVTIKYAEALYLKGQKDTQGRLVGGDQIKGNRNIIDDKEFVGIPDTFICDGGANRLFRPLSLRAYRYIEMEIETADEALVIEGFYGVFTGYPLKAMALFDCDDAELCGIRDVSWRTLRCCLWETYMDCPYYEQLQYVGDTRFEALVTLYTTGDVRPVRNAIEQFHNSKTAEGLICGAYPVKDPSVITTYCLFWVGMLYDYWIFTGDTEFVAKYLDTADDILAWYEKHIDEGTGMLGRVPYWNFVDWPKEWPWNPAEGNGGMPAGWKEGGSSVLTLQYAYILSEAADLFTACGREGRGEHFNAVSHGLADAAYKLCWDADRRLMADTAEKEIFSQHANVMAVLADAIATDEQPEVISRTLYDSSLIQCTLYYHFYLHRALVKTGNGDLLFDALGPWRTMLDLGLTTCAEKPEPTRSDCHGWGATPLYDFLTIVCGIRPASPGFEKVYIEPHLGELRKIKGQMPCPKGIIKVSYRCANGELEAHVILPAKVAGIFSWKGVQYPLKPGLNKLNMRQCD